ncbi:MAG: hypothetical protein IJF07_05725 [Lachnospiraceae bacterium]|nr:hypothetical protein [Lachnospiraceae bacterium]
MLRQAVNDYFRAFNIGNFKGLLNDFGKWYWIVYLSIILPIDWVLMDKQYNLIIYFMEVIPCIWMFVGVGCVPLSLPKIMFLCPMEKKEREDYVRGLFGVNVMVPVILAGCLQIIESMIYHQLNIFYLSNLFTLVAMSVSLLLFPDTSIIERGKRNMAFKPISRGYNITNIVLAAFHIYLMILAKNDGGQLPLGLCIYFTVSIMIQLLFTIAILRRNKALIIEAATKYEVNVQTHKEAKK